MIATVFRRARLAATIVALLGQAALLNQAGLLSQAAFAAEIGPPMLDINRQCDAQSRHNATAMSECVVAESEARAELLQSWSKYSDGDAEKCVKLGRKAKRLPYSAMAKCLAAEPTSVPMARQAQ